MTARHRAPWLDPPGDEAGGGAFRLLRPRSIRSRLWRLLVVSLVLVLALLGVLAAGKLSEYRAASDTARVVGLSLQVQDVAHQLQRERSLTNGLLGGETRFEVQLPAARRDADAALASLHGVVDGLDDDESANVRTALGALAGLGATRTQVDRGLAARTGVFDFYGNAISALDGLTLGLDGAGATRDAGLRLGLQALYALGSGKEQLDAERGFLSAVFAARAFADGEYETFAGIRAAKDAALADFSRYATPDQQSVLAGALRSNAASEAAGAEAIAANSPDGLLVGTVDPLAWWTQTTAVVDQLRTIQARVGADVTARAAELRADAARGLAAFGVVALVAVLIEVWLVVGAVRSVVGPLRSVAREADDVASRRLPQAVAALEGGPDQARAVSIAIPPRAGTEIRSVVAALDRVQETALELAAERAEVRLATREALANLGRRNQGLVRRQLALLDQFEQGELDPAALANLFELDHLATLMRRAAESLLVLVDTPAGLSAINQQAEPAPVTDLIRAGLAEVEEYRRVLLRDVDDALIAGPAVTALAHLLAELIENGLSFSPPDSAVEVYGRRDGDGYLLAVLDHGIGMSEDALAQANARLLGGEEFSGPSTRFLGHHVIGKLAVRLGVRVELSDSPGPGAGRGGHGVLARVWLPAGLVAAHAMPLPAAAASAEGDDGLDALVEATRDEPRIPQARSGGSTRRRPAPSPRPRPHRRARASRIEDLVEAAPDSDTVRSGSDPALDGAGPADAGPVGPYAATTDTVRIETERPGAGDIDPVRTGSPWTGPEPDESAADVEAGPAAAGTVPAPAEPAAVERTANGLVKRKQPGRRVAAAAPRRAREAAPAEPVRDRTPSEVRSMLTSFRSGLQRGEGEPAGLPGAGPPAEPLADAPAASTAQPDQDSSPGGPE